MATLFAIIKDTLSAMNGKGLITTVIALVATFIAATGYMTMTLNGRMTSIETRLYRVEDKIDRLDAKFDELLLVLAGRNTTLPLEGKKP